MQELLNEYKKELQSIAEEIQASDLLAVYLDSEEEEDYKAIIDAYEPKIAELHKTVANKEPLQLINLEKVLLNPAFEGLYLPKALGFSVIRGLVTDNIKYQRPQNHFREVLLSIVNSANFEFIKKRIGQSIQIGFALSSDIWITDIINSIDNKKVRQFLLSCKIDSHRDDKERKIAVNKYFVQFKNEFYQTADFPNTFGELKTNFQDMFNFLSYRILSKQNNDSFFGELEEFASNKLFFETDEYARFMVLYTNFFDYDDTVVKKLFNDARKANPNFDTVYLKQMIDLQVNNVTFDQSNNNKVTSIIDYKIQDDLTSFYELISLINAKNYTSVDALDTVKSFCDARNGLSVVNEAARTYVFNKFNIFISNLETTDFNEFRNITSIYEGYIKVFGNETFNQRLRDVSMKFIDKCLKVFVDKRGHEYQEVKKFVQHKFVELHFIKEKDAVEKFKTKKVVV